MAEYLDKKGLERLVENINEGATKLRKPVKLWGNEFDGSGDLDGGIFLKSISKENMLAYSINGVDLYATQSFSITNNDGDVLFLVEQNGNIELGCDEVNNINVTVFGNIKSDNITKMQEDIDSLKVPIVAESGDMVHAEPNKYYRVDVPVKEFFINIFDDDVETDKVCSTTVFITTADVPNVHFGSSKGYDILFPQGFAIEPDTTYELNFRFNGVKWILDCLTLEEGYA